MSAKRKRSAARMEKTVGADLEPVGNDLKFSIQISKNPESWLISNIFAVAKLTKSGENTSKSETPTQTCEIIEKEDDDNFDDDNDENEEDDDTEDGGDKVYKNLCENSVATLEATLITRGTTRNFHELCDMVSQEIQEAGTSLFDHHGKLYGPITKAVGKECNRGDFLYITSVEVKEPHRGKDIGISLCYAVMNALRDRYSLAVIFPAPLIHNPEILGVEKISRYFARAGFIQLCAGRPHSLNKYWVLESTKLPDTIKTKAEGSTIEVSKEPRNAKPEGVDKELIEAMNAFPEAPIDQMMFGSIHLNPTNMDLLQLKLREIISRGGDINRAGCVHVAAANGYTKTLTMLIEDFKAEVNTQDPAGLTPLHCAATMMQERTIPILLFNGADKKIRDYEGKTALQCCKDAKRSQENFLRSFGIPMQGKMQSADVCIALLKAL